jgi:hypothetical protein
LGCVDRDLDSNGSATDLFAFESLNSFLLLGFIANVNKAVTLALSRLPPPPTNNTSRVDLDPCVRKKRSESVIFDVEAKVGYKEDVLRRFTSRILTSGARCTRSSGFAF